MLASIMISNSGECYSVTGKTRSSPPGPKSSRAFNRLVGQKSRLDSAFLDWIRTPLAYRPVSESRYISGRRFICVYLFISEAKCKSRSFRRLCCWMESLKKVKMTVRMLPRVLRGFSSRATH